MIKSKTIKNKLYYTFMFIFLSLLLVGCSGNKNPLSASQITNDLKTVMNDTYSVDLIKNLEQKKIDLNKEDSELLKSKFDRKVDYKKINVSFNMESMKVDVKASYDLLYAFYNDKWILLSSNKANEKDWEFTFTETVDVIQIIDNLKDQSIEGFDAGFLSDAGKSTIKIDNQKTNKKEGLDIIDISIDVKTDFATFTIPATVHYKFEKGDWVFKKIEFNDELSWNVKYLVDEPTIITKEEAFDLLTNKDSALTYIANKDSITSYDIVGPNITATSKGIVINYDLYVKYENIGAIQYHLKKPLLRIGSIWSEGELSVDILTLDFSDLVGTWKISDQNYFDIKTFKDNKITGVYYESNKEFEFSSTLEIPNTPNSWIVNLNSTKTLPDNKIILNTEKKNFMFNGKEFIKSKTEEKPSEQKENTIEKDTNK